MGFIMSMIRYCDFQKWMKAPTLSNLTMRVNFATQYRLWPCPKTLEDVEFTKHTTHRWEYTHAKTSFIAKLRMWFNIAKSYCLTSAWKVARFIWLILLISFYQKHLSVKVIAVVQFVSLAEIDGLLSILSVYTYFSFPLSSTSTLIKIPGNL